VSRKPAKDLDAFCSADAWCVIPKSGYRFSDKITHKRKKTVESDSTSSNQTLGKLPEIARLWCCGRLLSMRRSSHVMLQAWLWI
jgi:hypothetical protein